MEHFNPESSSNEAINQSFAALAQRLEVIEETINAIHQLLADQGRRKEWYTVAEAAELLGKSDFTVREWARLGRVYASKRACGRGNTQEWIISDAELGRIENEGLLPT